MKSIFKFILLIGLAVSLGGFSATNTWAASAYDVISEIPVQHGGRVKPFHSFAQEVILFVTGKRQSEGISPTQLVWRWLVDPEVWSRKPLIPVSYRPFRKEFSVMLIDNKVSAEILLNHDAFTGEVEKALTKQRLKEDLLAEEKKRLELYERARVFQLIGEGVIPGWIPNPEAPSGAWLSFKNFATPEGQQTLRRSYPEAQIIQVQQSLRGLFIRLKE